MTGAFLLAVAQCGCVFGPKMLEKSHARYQESVLQVEEEQFLRNIVRLRYNEPNRTLQVSSIAAQYELQGSAEARPFFVSPNPSNSNVIFRTFTAILPDLAASVADRPTVTLVPSNDGDNVRRALTPITLETMALLVETSWPVSAVLRIWVERVNGVPNAVSASGPSRGFISDHARFLRITELMQFAQDHQLGAMQVVEAEADAGGAVPAELITPDVVLKAAEAGLEYRPNIDGKTWGLTRKENRLVMRINPEFADTPEVAEMLDLLNLEPGVLSYDVLPAPGVMFDPGLSPQPRSSNLHILPRSTSQALFYLANGVEVPPEHILCGYARPLVNPDDPTEDPLALTRGLFEVHVSDGHKPPPNAFVAIRYRDRWFYIDDRDQCSKATMALLLQINRLDFGNDRPAAPFLTLPVGR